MRGSVLAILLIAAGVVRADTSHSAATAASGIVRFVYGDGERELFADNSSVAVSRARRALAVYTSNWSNASDNEAGGTFEVVSLDTLRAIPFHLQLGPYPNEGVRAGRYEAVNRQLARDGFELPTEYETASGDDLSDEIQERFRDEAHSTVCCGTEMCPESAVVRFPRSRLTVGESGRVPRSRSRSVSLRLP